MRVVIIGAGGHSKVVADIVRANGHEVVCFVDDDESKIGQQVEPGGGRVFYTQAEFLDTLDEERDFDAVAFGFGDNQRRLMLYFELMGVVEMPPFIHPSAVVSPSAEIGPGTIIAPNVVVNAAAQVGRASVLNTGCVIEHDCVLADGVHVSPNATIAGEVKLGARAWVGAGATVIQCLSVGADSIVGANAVVVDDIPENVTVVGVPARTKHATQGML